MLKSKEVDNEHGEVCINVDKRSVKLTKHLYDFVSASALNGLRPEILSESEYQQRVQFSG